MQYEVTFAGFGGQGVLAIGQLLAKAGMNSGKTVVWIPSYGPEMRGGTAYCTVVIADRPIGSPIINTPTCAAVLNRPSFDKFESKVKPQGLLLVNSSLIDVKSARRDLDCLYVPANEIAIKAGNAKATNMAMLGAFVGRTKLVPQEAIRAAIEEKFSTKKALIELNKKVFAEGMTLAG